MLLEAAWDRVESALRQLIEIGKRWRQVLRHGINSAKHGGGDGREAGRSGTTFGITRDPRVGRSRGSRRDPQELPFRQLLRGLGLHVANGAAGRKDGSSSRVVQRLQPGRGYPF